MDFTILNAILTPVSLVLSFNVAYYAFEAHRQLKNKKNLPVAKTLVAVGLLFSFFSILSSLIYGFTVFTDNGWGHELSSLRSLITNVMIISTSSLMVKIYRNKI